MEENKDKCSKREKMAREGVINEMYTQKGYFVKVKNRLAIDKVCFSFVKKGNAKTDSFDIFMNSDIFNLWMEDVLSARMGKVLVAEKKVNEQYPKMYKYITGTNGEKSVGIMNSSKSNSYVLNGGVNGKYANVPITYDWLRETAIWFKLLYKRRQDQLLEIYGNTEKKESQFYKKYAAEEEQTPKQQYEQLTVITNGPSSTSGRFLVVPVTLSKTGEAYDLYIGDEVTEVIGSEQMQYIRDCSSQGIEINGSFAKNEARKALQFIV